MRPVVRYLLAAVALLVVGITMLTKHETVASGISSLANKGSSSPSPRENAAFVTLARNTDYEKLTESVKTYEANFNSRYHYDWVFLNNEEFSEEFKTTMRSLVSGTAKFGLISTEHWSIPSWVDLDKAKESWAQAESQGIAYGGSEPYRHMCRFESGFFFKHPLMQPYRYYWRVEPETSLLCKVKYDVFRFLNENGIKYSWTISITEWENTIPTLWKTVQQFMEKFPQHVHPNALSKFLSGDGLKTYNLCHFWSNFEIADMTFWRSDAYQDFFNHLDRTGKFFYERWGDAPVHSIAAALLLDQKELHFFEDIGYSHPPFQHCPVNQVMRGLECSCDGSNPLQFDNDHFDWHPSSCLRTYLKAKGNDKFIDPNPDSAS